jgi:colicin import membrane protein
VAAQKRAEEAARRAAELERMAATSFNDALNREADALSEDEEEQVAMSFAQGIYQLIVANWSRPPSARNGMEAQLIVELVPTGDVVGVTLVRSSGNDAFDRSAEQAIRKAGKFDVPKEPAVFETYFRRLPVLFKPEDLLR